MNAKHIFGQANFREPLEPSFSRSKRKGKVHDYTGYQAGVEYVFEMTSQDGGYMTGQGHNLKVGDYVLLSRGTKVDRYQVEQVEYYSQPSDMWIALLKQTPEVS